mmetsp:Transcript_34892/g.86787  ORF Transcript_34892/g.86787 Transcript_34892/m.86787 type:complete len:232 (+) Transcript_34892:150-845(+)
MIQQHLSSTGCYHLCASELKIEYLQALLAAGMREALARASRPSLSGKHIRISLEGRQAVEPTHLWQRVRRSLSQRRSCQLALPYVPDHSAAPPLVAASSANWSCKSCNECMKPAKRFERCSSFPSMIPFSCSSAATSEFSAAISACVCSRAGYALIRRASTAYCSFCCRSNRSSCSCAESRSNSARVLAISSSSRCCIWSYSWICRRLVSTRALALLTENSYAESSLINVW